MKYFPYLVFLSVKASFVEGTYKLNVENCPISLVSGMEVMCWGISKPHIVRSARLLQGCDRSDINLEYFVEIILGLPDGESWSATKSEIEQLEKHGWALCKVA